MSKWVVQTDGGSPKNPGPASFAFVVKDGDEILFSKSGFLPHASNNRAEYAGVTSAAFFLLGQLTLPAEIGFWSDSQLVVNQLNGDYRVNDIGLKPFYQEAVDVLTLLRRRTLVTIQWFRREHNTEADGLCNLVLERRGIEIVSKRKHKN